LITTTHAAELPPSPSAQPPQGSFDIGTFGDAGMTELPLEPRDLRAAVQPSDDAWDLLNRLAKVYVGPDIESPAISCATQLSARRRRRPMGVDLMVVITQVPSGGRKLVSS
jgi:hypothetical protein